MSKEMTCQELRLEMHRLAGRLHKKALVHGVKESPRSQGVAAGFVSAAALIFDVLESGTVQPREEYGVQPPMQEEKPKPQKPPATPEPKPEPKPEPEPEPHAGYVSRISQLKRKLGAMTQAITTHGRRLDAGKFELRREVNIKQPVLWIEGYRYGPVNHKVWTKWRGEPKARFALWNRKLILDPERIFSEMGYNPPESALDRTEKYGSLHSSCVRSLAHFGIKYKRGKKS